MSYFATIEGLVVMLFAKKVEAGVRVPNAKARLVSFLLPKNKEDVVNKRYFAPELGGRSDVCR